MKLSAALGGRTAAALTKGLRLVTVGDLLSHYPRRYARRGELTALNELAIDESVTIVAEVRSVNERTMRAKRGSILEVVISDGRGYLTLTFFNQPWRANELKPGKRGIFAGKIGDYRGNRQLAHPDYELFEQADAAGSSSAGTSAAGATGADATAPDTAALDDAAARRWAEQPIPIYPATSTMASWQIQKALGVVLDTLPAIEDPVPASVRTERGLVSFARAIELVHRPERDSDWKSARAALRFQEAFVLQAALLQQRALLRSTAAVSREPGHILSNFDEALPFALTGDQQIVGEEIAADLAAGVPMNRLVQGEVGSGKTLVALRAMLAVAQSGGQSALLAPTEVLAHQHLRSITKTLGPNLAATLRPTLLTGQLSTAERKKALLNTVSGGSSIVVGTHALLGDAVSFYDLGLVVVDEQHRFGVDQREALRQKGSTPPHVLVLTATPIPRTVAMTVFGDLDVSTIAELPSGRIPIESHVVPLAEKPSWASRIWERIAEELAEGRQAFVVCPAIVGKEVEAGEQLTETVGDAASSAGSGARSGAMSGDGAGFAKTVAPEIASVESTMALLAATPSLATKSIAALHGKLPSEEKDRIMRAFAAGDIDVLVATTVIEVGVDVPNASTMVILDADRFGVSQLHQLRGRVGRGGVPGLCLFVTRADVDSLARERVEAVASTLDGFELAQKDLELRREGDVLGSTQSGGRSQLRLLRVATDGDLITQARVHAAEVLSVDPTLENHQALGEALTRRLDAETEAFLSKS
ncbi:MAG: ATP-dependent DNA helicase RecG [Microbacteriaceae bacterium]